MIREIVVYEEDDGSCFNQKYDADKYDALYNKVEQLLIPLGNYPRYNERILHLHSTVKSFKYAICMLAADYFDNSYRYIFEECAQGSRHISHAERYVDDSNVRCLVKAFNRLACMSEDGFEYEQPYYSLHPSEFNGETISRQSIENK